MCKIFTTSQLTELPAKCLQHFCSLAITHLVDQESDGCDKRRVRVLSRSCHLCECGEKGDAVRAVHFTQPGLKPFLVLWVCWWTHEIMIVSAKNVHRPINTTVTFVKLVLNK